MQVSRDYLIHDKLIDFPIAERFLKLPFKNFLELEGVVPLPSQVAMINAIEDPRHKQIVGCLSRRTGKTFLANSIGFVKALEPEKTILIVSPNFSLTGISWNEQIRLLNKHGIEIDSKNKTDKEIKLSNGSLMKFGSAANADSLVGRSYDLIIYDEAAIESAGEAAYNIQLRPTLDKPNSKIIFISTPRGLNFFHDFYMRGFSEQFPTWISVHSTYRDNPRMQEEDVAEAKKGMSRAEFNQEYLAEFSSYEGMIYEYFDTEKHVVAGLAEKMYLASQENKFRYETIMGIDPGYRDATGALVLVYDTDEEVFNLVWEYEEAERTTAQHAEVFDQEYKRWDMDYVFVDSAAAQFRQDMSAMYDLPSNPAIKSVLDGIAFVQTLIEQDRLFIDAGCEKVILALNNYRWNMDKNLLKPKPVHDKFSHLADALRYALYSLNR